MLKLIMLRQNLNEALKRVEKNKGSHGVDKIPSNPYECILIKIGLK
ncbi:hypothetical protein [Natranaerobius trueperi]|nr:hypothetical protein [Natranaerobius trueperi]